VARVKNDAMAKREEGRERSSERKKKSAFVLVASISEVPKSIFVLPSSFSVFGFIYFIRVILKK